jgi:hypothetical protein
MGVKKVYDLPKWVEVYKETNKSIKVKEYRDKDSNLLNTSYYLFESKCLYDKNKTHKNIKKDIYLGRITLDKGLISPKVKKTIIQEEVYSKTYGNYLLLSQLTQDILKRLNDEFGAYGNTIWTIACLRMSEYTPYYDIEDSYNQSYFSVFDKTLSLSKTSLSELLTLIGKNRDKVSKYMRDDLDNHDVLIFDGTNIMCGSHNISYAQVGYKHGHDIKEQVNIMYAFSSKSIKPVYYKLFEGSVTDRGCFSNILTEMNTKKSVVLLDNGFESPKNITSLLDLKDKYILSLRRNDTFLTTEIINDTGRLQSKEKFTYESESVFAYEILLDDNMTRICIFYNKAIESVETSEYISKMNKGWKDYTDENYKEASRYFGLYIIKTNILNKPLKYIYYTYKSRFTIEYMFDTIKNTLEYDMTYMHSDFNLEGWLFINHITISIFYKVYELLKEKDLLKELPPRRLFKKLRTVIKQRNILDKKEKYELQVVPAKVKEYLKKLEIELK